MPKNIVVIGASSGGLSALLELVKGLNKESDAAYLIVLHLMEAPVGNYIISKLQERTTIKCVLAKDGLPLTAAHIYVAPPNYHMTVANETVRINAGATENRWRPSIDVLFRSASASYTNRVIGVILTGLLNDGTTGASAIKRCGGSVIVQDPSDAEYGNMPASTIKHVPVDYVVPLSAIAATIQKIIVDTDLKQRTLPPQDIIADVLQIENFTTSISFAQEQGSLTPFTCPDCGGVLFLRDKDAITRFKCHTGHSYSLEDLLIKQADTFEQSLWYAIRSLEQRKELYPSLLQKSASAQSGKDYKKEQTEIEKLLNTLKGVLSAHQQLTSNGDEK